MVAVTGDPAAPEVIDRRRIAIVDSTVVGASQPYHFAENLELAEADQYLTYCNAACGRIAAEAIRTMAADLSTRGYDVRGCAILLAAGRQLPALVDILASHALIHTAEGEFFRQIVRTACDAHGIAITGIRERDLEARAESHFGRSAARLQEQIAGMGKSLGAPWTRDQKAATLAATVMLANLCGDTHS
jgi:hypothetical protein